MDTICPVCNCKPKEQHDHDCPHRPGAPDNAMNEYLEGTITTNLDAFPEGTLSDRPHFLYGLCST